MPKIDISQTWYDEYLNGDIWKRKREQRLAIDKYRCSNCGTAKNLHVHHVTYEHLGDEPMEDLITLCQRCHELIHRMERQSHEIRNVMSNHLEVGRDIINAVFVGWCLSQCEELGLNPRKYDDTRPLRRQFAEEYSIEETQLSILQVQLAATAKIRETVRTAFVTGNPDLLKKLPKKAISKYKQELKEEIEKIGENMPKIDMNAYNEATALTGGGEFKRMPAGGFVCRTMAVRTEGRAGYGGGVVDYVKSKDYVKVIYDIAEGEFAGKFSDDYWAGEDKDYAHQFYFSWKNLGALKGNVQALEESNPGWDVMADFQADNWQAFIGKYVGLVFGEEEYRANDGSIKVRLGFPRLKSVQDIRAGNFKVPALKRLDGGDSQGYAAPAPTVGATGASVYDADVPF